MKCSTRQEKCDLLIQVTAWAGFTYCENLSKRNLLCTTFFVIERCSIYRQVKLTKISDIGLYMISLNSGLFVHRHLCSIFQMNMSEKVGHNFFINYILYMNRYDVIRCQLIKSYIYIYDFINWHLITSYLFKLLITS